MGEKINLKEEYIKLSKKHKLPKFEDLNSEIGNEKDVKVLKKIRKEFYNKIESYIKILEDILFPTSLNPVVNYEAEQFDEEEKIELIKLHKKLKVYEKQSQILDIESNIELEAEYIKKLFNEIKEIKKEIKKVLTKIEKTWK